MVRKKILMFVVVPTVLLIESHKTFTYYKPVLLGPVSPMKIKTSQLMHGLPQIQSKGKVIHRKKQRLVKPGTPQILSHFTVADYLETGTYGPSAEASVGSKQVMVGAKGRVRTLNKKTGKPDGILNLSHDRFFSPVMGGTYTADPNIVFDPTSKRWFLFCNNNPFACLLAMSSGDPITPQTEWSFFVVDRNSDPAFENPQPNTDYTTLGVDEKAVYCAQIVFDFANPSYVSSAAYVIPKESLIQGKPKIFAFRNLVNQKTFNGPHSMWAATNFDKNPKHGFFASTPTREIFTGQSDQILINKVSFTANGPILSQPIGVTVDSYVETIAVPALGTPKTHLINPVAGVVMCPVHVRNGKLLIAHNIGVDNTGKSTLTTTITRNAIRFYEIDVSQKHPKLIRQATLFAASPHNDFNQRSYLDPSVMSNKEGKVVVGFTACGAKERLNAGVVQVNNGVFGKPVLYTKSTSDYNATEDWEFDPDARWGDHTRTSVDPCDDTTFWTAQQWCSAKNTWALEVARIRAN